MTDTRPGPERRPAARRPDPAMRGRPGHERHAAYGEGSIQILEGLEAVRKRPGMYIGDTSRRHRPAPPGVRGGGQLHRRGPGRPLPTTSSSPSTPTTRSRVVDNGRGIPTGVKMDDKHEPKRSAAEIALTELHAGGKFNQNSYKVSGGLHGVGVSCVNAPVRSGCALTVRRDGKVHQIEFSQGRAARHGHRAARRRGGAAHDASPATPRSAAPRCTSCPTPRSSADNEFHYDILAKRLRELTLPEQRREDPPRGRAQRQGRRLRLRRRRRRASSSSSTQGKKTVCTRTSSTPSGEKMSDQDTNIGVEVADAVERRLPRERAAASPTTSRSATAART